MDGDVPLYHCSLSSPLWRMQGTYIVSRNSTTTILASHN
jgi:hypothetical protein